MTVPTRPDGIYVMLKEVIDNAVDEFIMGQGKKISITRGGPEVQVRDFGRGIPLGKLVDCVSKINTGGKYNDDVFQFSVGLNGVGNKAVNALSSEFEVISFRDGKFKRATFERGKKKSETGGKETKERSGTLHSALSPIPRSLAISSGAKSISSTGCATTRFSTVG